MPKRRRKHPPLSDAQISDMRGIHRQVNDVLQGTGQHARRKTGIYRGIVEYNRDPEQRGRIMVRLVSDGPEMQIENAEKARVSTFDLGWCEPCFGLAGGRHFGSFSVPAVGARVFVMFIHADEKVPVYFGGWYANPARPKRYGATKTTLEPPLDQVTGEPRYPAMEPPYWGHWEEEPGNEVPIEARQMMDNSPDNHVLFKTLKGASLIVKDRDYDEELVLTEHRGGELRFESNTPTVEGAEGPVRRGTHSITQHSPPTISAVAFSHKMRLLDAAAQGILSEVSNRDNDTSAYLVQGPLDTAKAIELKEKRLSVEMEHGKRRLRIAYMDGDLAEGYIEFDALSQQLSIVGMSNIQITSDVDITLEAPTVRIKGDVDIDGEIRHLGGKKIVFMDNDTDPYSSQFVNFQAQRDRSSPNQFPRRSSDEGELGFTRKAGDW